MSRTTNPASSRLDKRGLAPSLSFTNLNLMNQSPIDEALQIPMEVTWSPPFKARDHDKHQEMLLSHKAVKQERLERSKRERHNPPRKYSGHYYS